MVSTIYSQTVLMRVGREEDERNVILGSQSLGTDVVHYHWDA
jgi:hypothetical protein